MTVHAMTKSVLCDSQGVCTQSSPPTLISKYCIYALSLLIQSFLSCLELQAHMLWLPGASLCNTSLWVRGKKHLGTTLATLHACKSHGDQLACPPRGIVQTCNSFSRSFPKFCSCSFICLPLTAYLPTTVSFHPPAQKRP